MDESEREGGGEVGAAQLGALPGLARIAVGAWYRGATWGIGTALGATRRVAEAAVSGESAAELIDEVREETAASLRRILGVAGQEPGGPITDAFEAVAPDRKEKAKTRAESLRERGAALLERAAEIDEPESPVHPGFDRIVDQLAPDEARILKLLVNEGPQPIVYVHKAAPLGIGARDVARRLSLIGPEAGCLRPELVPAYIDNLVRLGLVAIRRDPIPDEQAYQVVEAQPQVVEAIRAAGGPVFKGHTSRRSLHVTDFGRAFCQVVFPPEHLSSQLGAVEVNSGEQVAPPELELGEDLPGDA